MSFFIGTDDTLCTKTDALDHIGQMRGTTTSTHDVQGEDHAFFGNPAGNQVFMDQLKYDLKLN